jgi:XTP/dITP diphosphohydrolase
VARKTSAGSFINSRYGQRQTFVGNFIGNFVESRWPIKFPIKLRPRWQIEHCGGSFNFLRAAIPFSLGPVTTLLIATRNGHKVHEIRAILGAQFHYLTLAAFPGAPEVQEDAATFSGNATKKAVQLAKWLAQQPRNGPAGKSVSIPSPAGLMYVLADDSGLEVDALNGAPGVHSARFAALDSGCPGNSPTAENNSKLLRLLRNVPLERRTARFRCVVALTPVVAVSTENASPACAADEFELQTELFDGACEGRITLAPRGQGGFGYDPVFVPEGYDQTFGQLPEAVKNRLSHRARALAKLRDRLAR